MRNLVFLLALMLGVALAGEFKTIVEPQVKVTKRVMFVVDVSGSMDNNNRIPRALAAVREIANQPLDEMEIAVIAFADEPVRWEGIADDKVPKGWAGLPSADAVQKAQEFIGSADAGLGTIFTAPLMAALKEPRDELTVVFITDGDIEHTGFLGGEPAETLKAVAEMQEWRKAHGFGMAAIYCVEVAEQTWLKELVSKNGGGLYLSKN